MGTSTAAIRAPMSRVKSFHAPAIFAIAIIARLATILIYVEKNQLPNLHSLGYENVYIALSLNSGHGFSSPFGFPSGPTALLPPGYPLLIAAVIHVLGAGSAAAWFLILLNTLASLLTLFLLMAVARRHFGNRTANIAGLLFAISPPLLFAPLYIWDTCISALILTAAIGLVPSRGWSNYQFALLGVGAAVAILINPALSVVLLATLAWSAYRTRVFSWVAIVAFLVVFSPWPIRNALVMHSFVPLRTSFGYELWMGNHPGADGNLPAAMGPRDDLSERHLFLQVGEVRYTQLKKSLAYSYISAHPREFAQLTGKRFMRFWTGTGEATGSPAHTTYYLSALSIVGLALLYRRRQTFVLYLLPLLLFPIPYYITHAEVRYQLVVDPLLAILAGYACESFFAWCARRPAPSPELASSTGD